MPGVLACGVLAPSRRYWKQVKLGGTALNYSFCFSAAPHILILKQLIPLLVAVANSSIDLAFLNVARIERSVVRAEAQNTGRRANAKRISCRTRSSLLHCRRSRKLKKPRKA